MRNNETILPFLLHFRRHLVFLGGRVSPKEKKKQHLNFRLFMISKWFELRSIVSSSSHVIVRVRVGLKKVIADDRGFDNQGGSHLQTILFVLLSVLLSMERNENFFSDSAVLPNRSIGALQ